MRLASALLFDSHGEAGMAKKQIVPTKTGSKRVHSVSAVLSVGELTKAGSALNLQVAGSDGKLGELEIGRGALYWTGKGRQKSKRLSWTRFAEMMNELAYS
jgi:hypothetical protein